MPTGAMHPDERAPHHVSFCVLNANRDQGLFVSFHCLKNPVTGELVATLEAAGVIVSGGSACSSGSNLPSRTGMFLLSKTCCFHVLVAIGVPTNFIHGSVRITISHTIHILLFKNATTTVYEANTYEEVRDQMCPILNSVLRKFVSSPKVSKGR